MKIRKLSAIAWAFAIASAITGANNTTKVTYADAEETTTVAEELRCGDKIWITDEQVTYYGSDKRFSADVSSKEIYDIYIISRYNDEYWRVHVPFLNEPERVLLIPVEGYDIMVLSHDNLVVGDLNKDGQVDTFDMIFMRKILIGEYDFNLYDYSDIDGLIERSIVRQMADMNNDAQLNVADGVCLQRFLLGYENYLE